MNNKFAPVCEWIDSYLEYLIREKYQPDSIRDCAKGIRIETIGSIILESAYRDNHCGNPTVDINSCYRIAKKEADRYLRNMGYKV